MNTNTTNTTRQPLAWLLIIGLASLALLWPLSALWQIGHGLPRVLTILGITAVVWIGVVGFGRVARPVLTLTFAGVLHGFIALVLAGFVSGGQGPFGDISTLWVFIPALLESAGVGALVGLAALGVQKALGPRGRLGGRGRRGAASDGAASGAASGGAPGGAPRSDAEGDR